MANDEFKLTPKTDEVNQNFATEVLASIQIQDAKDARTHPVLIAWSLRMPKGLHRQLQKAAKLHGVSMTKITNESLRRTVQALLDAGRPPARPIPEPEEPDDDSFFA